MSDFRKMCLRPLGMTAFNRRMLRFVPIFAIAFALLIPQTELSAQAENLIRVSNVNFSRVSGAGVQMTVQFQPERNTLPNARNDRFLDDVRLRVFLSYQTDSDAGPEGFDFYRSEVRMVGVESNRRYAVHFFLPQYILDRDRLRDPFAWIVQFEVDGNLVPLNNDQFDQRAIRDRSAYDSFLSRANAEGAVNDGILVPHYLAPELTLSSARIDTRSLPTFRRFESLD